MKILLKILTFAFILDLAIGFYLQYKKKPKSEVIIGSGVVVLAFVIIPLFIFHRYKNKDLSKYIFNPKENKENKSN